ncbi:MAG: SCO family protein [Burkholderiaceae bacterium]
MHDPSPRLNRPRRRLAWLVGSLLLLAPWAMAAPPTAPAAGPTAASGASKSSLHITVPNVQVQDQDGRTRQFFDELVKGRTVAVNFVFTSCTSICTPLAATFKGMQDELARRGVNDARLISVSVDPLNDTPQELSRFARKFGAGANWTFVTGSRKSIDAILLAFGVGTSTSDPSDHSPIVFLGHEPGRRWTRAHGLAAPAVLARQLLDLRTAAPAAALAAAQGESAGLTALRGIAAERAQQASSVAAGNGTRGAAYFTNLPLLTQDRPIRFYDDLIKGRVVLVHSFFATCRDVCSPMTHNLARAQKLLQERFSQPVQLVSISTDPLADVPDVLREYARRHDAGPGWAFVTGKKENVDWVLHKLGLYEEAKEAHTAVLWVGNDRTGRWLKLHGMTPPEAIVDAVRKIL